MSLLIMQHSADFDLEEIESHLYSQVFHSTENWDQTPDHPVLSKVPERQVTQYSISNHAVNAARYWDGTTQAKQVSLNINAENNSAVVEKTTENTVNNSAVVEKTTENTVNNSAVVEGTTENTTKSSETNDNDNTVQNKNDKNVARKVGFVEEYIRLEPTNNQNETSIDFSKDDFSCQQNFFYKTQNKLLQQSETQNYVATTPNNLNNNFAANNQFGDLSNPFADLINKIKVLEQENTVVSLKKAKNLTAKLKQKQLKHERRIKRLLKNEAKKEKKLRKLGLIPKNNIQPFSFMNQFNNIQRKPALKKQNFALANSPVNSNKESQIEKQREIHENPIDKQTQINESPIIKQTEINQQKEIIDVNDSFVILSDSDSDSDEVIEVPLPADEIVYVDSSSEISDADDTICADNIVENPNTTTTHLSASPTTSNSITEENIVPGTKLEDSNDSETTEINNKSEMKSDSEIVNNSKKEQIINSEEVKIEENEVIKNIEENATTLSDNEEKIDETKSPNQTRNLSNASINEIETERAELLCTPDSNTNDFMAHDVCNLNKSNFCFNFNLHGSDLGMSGKEIPKNGLSITDVYETESSCSEAGTTSKNRSYFSEVDFENPSKDIFAEPDLAKFSSFITPIRNRNISNVANSSPDFAPIQTKAGVVDSSSFKLNLFNQEDPRSSDEYNSDPTILPVMKKAKKKKKKAKKKDTNETTENTPDDNVIEEQPEASNNTEVTNKTKKNKRKHKAITDEEPKNESLLLNEPEKDNEEGEPVKLSKAKERRLKQKNKRKSAQMANAENSDSSNKKLKNATNATNESKVNSDTQTKQNVENKKHDTLCTNKDNVESLIDKNVPKSLEELNSTADYYDKVDSYFADDILYKELEVNDKPECSSNILKRKQTTDDENIEINVNTSRSNSETSMEKFACTDTFREANEDETQIINVSSDSEEEITQSNDKNTSSNGGKNIVLNTFSPEKSNVNEGQTIVANPFSFVQNFERLNHKKSFKDFWTNDMDTFYNESWGHEDYDITAVHQSMPSDFSKWSVNTADEFPVKGKKRGPMCLRCREFGHMQFRCPKIHEAIKCSTCGDSDHTSTRCPNSICTRCRSSTQHHTTSCNNCSNYKTIRCPICNYIGHLSRDCPDLWRRYHLTTNDNNLLVESSIMLKPSNMLWCSNCAKRGHSANNCTLLRTDHFPTYPGIQNYTPAYNNASAILATPPEPEIPVRIFDNVNLSQIRNYRTDLVENNNKKYLNMIKHLRKHISRKGGDINLNDRLNYLHNAASSNRFNKQKIGELYRISKIIRNSR